ncbi:glycosyltransferase [Cellulomonas sp. RIT-PI-Y]|uniref:glycosyltransferase family protein n=1 Tax=Cellulomonas sp. RIT-PI-Y TaxID=3035297 RepID=UPI0021D913F4|nr:glycosyltransferase [Cellulomonas sp. RIT-PI-Y]
MTPAPARLLHLTRMPPSPSGVAAYAAVFRTALAEVAPTETVALPPDATASQSFPLAGRLIRRLRGPVADPGTVLVVEQAGRGLAEFWAAWWLTRRGARVWLMVHDVPALSGGAFFGRLLDRRGGRRLAALLSGTLGRRAERGLLTRAERVFCLSPSGARALASAHGLTRAVEPVPHVAILPPLDPPAARRVILVPGYVASADDVVPLLPALATLPADWRLQVGACPDDARDALVRAAVDQGLADRVDLLGFTDEAGVRAAFARAAIVVRWRRSGWSHGAGRYAVSGPLIAAFAHACAVLTNDDRGAAHLFERSGAQVVEGADALIAALATLVRDQDERLRRAAAGRILVESEHTPVAVAALLRGGA